MPHPHVLILGAGLSGLILAQCLRKQDISFEIFESDDDLHSPTEDGIIALHSMLDELTAALPNDLPPLESIQHVLPSDFIPELSVFAESRETIVGSMPEKPVICVKRQRLRELLTQDIDNRWGLKADRIEQDGREVRLIFEDGEIVDGDVLVGADGAESFVRAQLSTNAKFEPLPLLGESSNGRVVLIGDAASSRMPFRNEGALQDAVQLSRVLDSVGNDYDTIVAAFQNFAKEILPRRREAVAGSGVMQNLDVKLREKTNVPSGEVIQV